METGNELRSAISGEMEDDADVRARYAHDASIFEVLPRAIAYPANAADVAVLARYADRHGAVSLTARGAGTDMSGGPLSESVVLDFTRYFTKIGVLQNDRITVEPGVYYRDFEKATLAEGLIMPSYPASRELCTLGGMVANNAGGELTLRYGKTVDYVARLTAVLADGNEYALEPLSGERLKQKLGQKNFEGECYRKLKALIESNRAVIERGRPRVSKNSSGYYLWDVWNEKTGVFDLTKLFVGSQGTLGLITEVEFRLIRLPPRSQMVIIFLDDLSRLGEMVNVILAEKPTTFESYDDKTLRLAARFAWGLLRRLGLSESLAILVHAVPEVFSILKHGYPKLVLQVTFSGEDAAALRAAAEKLIEKLQPFAPRYTEVIRSHQEEEGYWLVRRESFNLLRTKVRGKQTAPFIDDIVVRPEILPEFLPKIQAILEEYKAYMVHNIAGHIGNGNFHIIPLMDLSDEKTVAVIPEIAKRVYDLVLSYGGSISGEHNDGIIRTPFVRQQFGDEMTRLFEETKKIFDPKNIFNPGKKVGGSLTYAIGHIKRV